MSVGHANTISQALQVFAALVFLTTMIVIAAVIGYVWGKDNARLYNPVCVYRIEPGQGVDGNPRGYSIGEGDRTVQQYYF